MLTVKDLMTKQPDTVGLDTCLREVLAKMNLDGCRHLPVVEDGKLLGIVTDRDIRLAINSPFISEDEDIDRADILERLDAQSCMTPDPMTVTPETPAHEAADLLSLHKFGGLPVIDAGSLVGIVTTVDFLRHVAEHSRA